MTRSKINAVFKSSINDVWNTVTSLTEYGWRSDLERIEVVSDSGFVEYTKEGYATSFRVTNTVFLRRWEFDMENGNMSGHWIGCFTEKDGGTEIEFTADVESYRLWLEIDAERAPATWINTIKGWTALVHAKAFDKV